MKQTREEFLKDPHPIMLEDLTKEEQEKMLSLIFRRPVEIKGDRVIFYKTKEETK